MGKIIRNGIKYSGTTNSADKINYNNTLSGLEAETAQEAFDELNTKIKNGGSNIKYLTKAQYEALPDSKLTDDVEYRITDAHTTNRITAEDITYGENTVAAAVDELNDNVELLIDNVDELSNSLGVDIKIIDGIPHWSERGADSWSPFSSGEGVEAIVEYLGTCALELNDTTKRGYIATLPDVDISEYSKILWCVGAGLNGSSPISVSDVIVYSGDCTLEVLCKGWGTVCMTENTKPTDKLKFYTGNMVSTEYMPVNIVGIKEVASTHTDKPEIEIVPLVPTLTSNTGSNGMASAGSIMNAESHDAWRAFDGDKGTIWSSPWSQDPTYVQYEFTNPQKVHSVSYTARQDTTNHIPATMEVLLKINGAWVSQTTFAPPKDASTHMVDFNGAINNVEGVRWHCSGGCEGNAYSFAELQVYGELEVSSSNNVDLSALVDVPYDFNNVTGDGITTYLPFTSDSISKLVIDVGYWNVSTSVYVNDNLIYQARRDEGTVVVDITQYLTTSPMKLNVRPTSSSDITGNYTRHTHFDVIEMKNPASTSGGQNEIYIPKLHLTGYTDTSEKCELTLNVENFNTITIDSAYGWYCCFAFIDADTSNTIKSFSILEQNPKTDLEPIDISGCNNIIIRLYNDNPNLALNGYLEGIHIN